MPLLTDDLTLVGLELAADQAKKCTLAFTVATQQADAFALLDLQLDVVE